MNKNVDLCCRECTHTHKQAQTYEHWNCADTIVCFAATFLTFAQRWILHLLWQLCSIIKWQNKRHDPGSTCTDEIQQSVSGNLLMFTFFFFLHLPVHMGGVSVCRGGGSLPSGYAETSARLAPVISCRSLWPGCLRVTMTWIIHLSRQIFLSVWISRCLSLGMSH